MDFADGRLLPGTGGVPSDVNRTKKWSASSVLVIATIFAAIGCFAGALGGPFMLDDVSLIANNPNIHSLARWRDWFAKDFWDVDLAQAQLLGRVSYFRPSVLASYALDWQIGGGAAWVLHATNLALHGAVALLAFATLRRWIGTSLPAAVGALLFAVHPAKAESVAWISGRPDILLTLGVLLASWGVARRLRREPGGAALELVGTVLAYSAKEHAIVLPAFVLVESWVAQGRPPLEFATLKRVLRAVLPQLLLALAYLAARQLWLPLRQPGASELPATVHLGFILETLGRLGQLALWPADLSMTQASIRTGPDGARLAIGYMLGGALLLGSNIVFALTTRRRWPALALGAALWLGLLLPVSNLIWNGLPALTSPRFLYLPLFGLTWCVAELFAWAGRAGWIKMAGGAVAIAALALGTRSLIRSADFASATAYWSYEVGKQPNHPLGYAFALEYAARQGQPHRALRLAARGVAVSAADFSQHTERSTLAFKALQLLALLTADVQRAELEALTAFISDLNGDGPAQLRTQQLVLDIPPGSRARSSLKMRYPELLLIQADIATRLGDDQGGLLLARRAVEACSRCATEWALAAKIALRAGDRELARVWFAGPRQLPWPQVPGGLRRLAETERELYTLIAREEGPQRILHQAQREILLGMPGRAYATLTPHRADILNAGEPTAHALAEVAWRAGASEDARSILSNAEPERARRLLGTWEALTAWHENSLAADADLSFEPTLNRLLEGNSS
jgi:protein O-mannosyl-transferase